MIEEYEDGVLSVSYDHEPGLYGNLLSQNRNGVTSYYHYDGRGDTVALTDDSGNVTDTKEYDAWGNVIGSSGSTVTPYQFVGKLGYHSDSTVLRYFVRERAYQQSIARWTAQDPLLRAVSNQCYCYSLNSPLSYFDPSGLKEIRMAFKAFIHKRRGKWLDEPGGVFCEFKTDERDFNSKGTSRIASYGAIDRCDIGFSGFGPDTGPVGGNLVGESERRCYGISTVCFPQIIWKYETAKAFPSVDTVESTNNWCSASIHFVVAAGYPFKSVSPSIDYDVEFHLSANRDVVTVLVSGRHDGFPDYEAVVNDNLVYEYFSPYAGPTPVNLGGGPEVRFARSITIEAPTKCRCDGSCKG